MMFGDIFDTEEELLTGDKGGQLQSHWDRQPKNCAHNLPMPEIPRKKGYPMGLKNQGSTCYLNSLLQILFHTPQLRQLILSLPLCKQTTEQVTDFVDKSRRNFLLGFQRLFSEMTLSDVRAVGTEYLNKSFGWQGSQHLQQQDIQQAMRIIFDTIQRALFGTQYQESVRSLFKGSTIRYKTCRFCGQSSERPEIFYDISLQVKNITSVESSFLVLTTAEGMQGDNKVDCDHCMVKQEMWLGTRLNELPSILVLTLNRFDFDYEKMDRVRINSQFLFDLELNLSQYMQMPDSEYNQYELYGILIHRGSAHGGHYISYVRDILHQSDWNQGLEDAKAQQLKIKQAASANQQKPKKQQKQDKVYTLKQPVNQELKGHWYAINDNTTTALDVNKITSQYEGSESAYILFYRRKGLVTSNLSLEVPKYFSSTIIQANKVIQADRQIYNNQKMHIIITIGSQTHKLRTDMKITQLISTFVPLGSALVQQSTYNGLPYYPMQFINHPDHSYDLQSTFQSSSVIHESIWKLHQLSTPQYQVIRSSIGKQRLPFEIVLLDGEAPRRIVCYSDQNFLMLRIKIEKLLNIPYEKQILTLITPYKQTILTDVSENDDILLPKLGIVHGGQILAKSLGAEDQQKEGEKQQKATFCFLIERDDVIGLKRIYFQKTRTLQELLTYTFNSEMIEQGKRRFRNLNGNRLYYNQHYTKRLQELQFTEQMIKLRLQKGEIPIRGDICIKIKMQSQLYKTQNNQEVTNIEKIFDPNVVITEVKQWACSSFGLDIQLHKLYFTDWVGQPVRSITREKLTLFQSNFGRQELVCLRDIHSPIGAQLIHLEVYATKTGSPDSVEKEIIYAKIQQFKTVLELKELLISTIQQLHGVSPERLRLRQIKRDYMFGNIWREAKKSIKSVTINSNKIVYQILQNVEELRQQQIVLILKKRNHEKRTYEGSIELIFEAGRNPTVQELTEAVRIKVGSEEPVKTIKYVNYDFEWVEISRQNIEKQLKTKKNNNKGQKKEKTQGKKEDQNKKEQHKKPNENQPKNQKKSEKPKKAEKKHETEVEERSENPRQPTNEKMPKEQPKKQPKQKNNAKQPNNNLSKQLQQCFNLRKAPILLKDGDWIGWGATSNFINDDLQTDEDLSLRVLKQQKGTASIYRGNDKGGFKINVDF